MAEPFTSDRKKSFQAAWKGLAQKLHVQGVVDSFTNAVTGLGTSRSKVTAGGYAADPILDAATLEALFESNDLAATIVTKPVDDALRGGFGLEREGEDHEGDRELVEEIQRALEGVQTREMLHRGAVFGRLFGGGGLILGVRDGGSLETRLDDRNAGELVEFIDYDLQDMTASSWYPDGKVELYWWNPCPKAGGPARMPARVHESRLLSFPGALTTNRGRARNRGWDHSVLQRVYNALKSFDGMFASTDAMFADASQAVFRLQGLIQSLAEADGSGSQDVQTRLQLLDLMRSSAKAVMLDAGDETGAGAEDFTVIDRASLGTIDGVITQYYIRLAAAARMPLTVLLGMSPAGMDATGESDMILYYNTVDIYRRQVLEPRVLRVVRIVATALGDENPETWKVVWPELARPKPLDVRTAEKMAIDGAVALVTAQVVAPEEVALNFRRIGERGALGMDVDLQSRKKALTEALAEIGNREMTGSGAPEEAPTGAAPPTKSSERKTPSKTAGKQV